MKKNVMILQRVKVMVNLMEWQKQRWNHQNAANVEMMYVKVMTDEQLETLRKQIAVYATICEQLIEMHKTLSTHQDLTGKFVNIHLITLLIVFVTVIYSVCSLSIFKEFFVTI